MSLVNLPDLVLVEARAKIQCAGLVTGEPDHRIDVHTGDLLGASWADLLDVHSAFGRSHDCDAARVAIENQRQVELAPMSRPCSM